jgi:hypothetical protein
MSIPFSVMYELQHTEEDVTQPLKYDSKSLKLKIYERIGRGGVKNIKLAELKKYYKQNIFLRDMLGQQMLNLGLTRENIDNEEFWNNSFEEAINNSYGLYLQYKKEDEYQKSEEKINDIKKRMIEESRRCIEFNYTSTNDNVFTFYLCPWCYDFYVTKPGKNGELLKWKPCLKRELQSRQLMWVLSDKRIKEQMGKESEELFKKIVGTSTTSSSSSSSSEDDSCDSYVDEDEHDNSVEVFVEEEEEDEGGTNVQQPKRQRLV